MSTRVVQWATGTTGRLALRAVIDEPELELVGVRVYDPAKVGRDAGDLCGVKHTGVTATDDKVAVLDLHPDLVLYMGSVEKYREACVADVIDLLAAGIDVVATGSSFIDIRAFDPEAGRDIEAACADGSSTFLGLGLFPGFWGEAIAPLLSRLAFRCDRIAVREAMSYAGYPSTEMMFDVMGYGRPPESDDAVLGDITSAGYAFVSTAMIVAKALDLEVASVEPFREVAVTDSELHVAAGVVPAGTVGAMKLGIRAECGPMEILVEHVTWMGPDVVPEWSQREGYEIEFDGEPTLRCNLVLGTKGENHTEMGCLGTAMHAVHAIPIVRAASPGIIDLADTAGFVGRLQ